ncbi:AarF/ABC1/UbiB kinase family protein [Deltaproteobacteria bacterium TL4]
MSPVQKRMVPKKNSESESKVVTMPLYKEKPLLEFTQKPQAETESAPKKQKKATHAAAASLFQRTEQLLKEAGAFTYRTFKIPQAFLPISQLLVANDTITREQLTQTLDNLFAALYDHPLTQQTRKLTTYLREQNFIPNENTTESLIRYVINQSIARSPVPVPEVIINEFWTFFHELFSVPELKGLDEVSLDILRLVLHTYEPLLFDLINLLKETRKINQEKLNELINRVHVIRGDLQIIRRQIKALRYIKPFFQTDPRDFGTQAQIVARMVREFGPFFIKMAQVAAANSDFLPEEISKELQVFQEDVPPMNASEVLDAFQECFGKSPYECYFGFDAENPIKSGSIGSVYLAKKPMEIEGKEVLVPIIIKIGRHNLDREFLMGKTVIGLALVSSQYWAPHSKLAPFLEALQEQVEEFIEGFQRELNFEDEAEIQQKFALRAQESKAWKVPEVYSATRRILEMEYLDGAMSLSQATSKYSGKKKEKFQREVADRFLFTVLTHIFVYHEFHGDLHPGNVMVSPKGEIYLIDWGNTVHLKGKWEPVWEYLVGAISADVDRLTDALINISTDPEANLERREEICNALKDTLKKKDLKPLGKNFLSVLAQEGLEGLYKRCQTVMHLMSNTQHLGLVVKGDYIHLSRSLFALAGSYSSLYEGLPKTLMLMDLLKAFSQFPLLLMKDRFEIRRMGLRKELKMLIPFVTLMTSQPQKESFSHKLPAWSPPARGNTPMSERRAS